MEDQSRVEKLLEEIRDAQRESLEEYKRVTSQSLELQQKAVNRQEQLGSFGNTRDRHRHSDLLRSAIPAGKVPLNIRNIETV
ncbi:MAG: hypothetical protein DMF62_17840 [Acidobacteria bacterium]|nr:MAG: hypothetical protein DMF62_17840 [Acidobacteriota bacterium]